MAENITLLKVFIASPGDVNEERVLLESVFDEINATFANKKGIHLSLIKWETHAYSSTGQDAQAVINNQIGNDYDVFIGILWKKFGTPTQRGASGTAEEFDAAYNRHLENQNSIRVMFYFRDTPVPPSEMDYEQLKLIKDFRNSIENKGVLHYSYKQIDEFERLVRVHLINHLNDYGVNWGIENSEEAIVLTDLSTEKDENNVSQDEAEVGFLDLIINTMQGFEQGVEIFNYISDITSQMSDNMEQHTNKLNDLPKPIDPKHAKSITNDLADELAQYANNLQQKLPELSGSYRSAIDSFTQSAQLLVDFQLEDSDIESQINGIIETATTVRSQFSKLLDSLIGARNSLKSWPRMTTRLNHAKKDAIEAIQDYITEIEAAINITISAEQMMENVLLNK